MPHVAAPECTSFTPADELARFAQVSVFVGQVGVAARIRSERTL
jgi:hypothetical protein